MSSLFARPLWVAGKIWFIAVVVNTLLGTLYLTDLFKASFIIGNIAGAGLLYGTAFSFPIFLALFIVLIYCMNDSLSGEWIFRIVFICGIVLTIFMFFVFNDVFGRFGSATYGLLCIAILSSILGIGFQHKSLFMLGNYQPSK